MSDPDDWFAEIEPPPRPHREAAAEYEEVAPIREDVPDEWEAAEPEPEGLLQTLAEWRVVIGLVVLAATVLAVLAVAGVFSTSTPRPAAVTTTPPATTRAETAPTHTTSTQTTTTTAATTDTTATAGPTTTLKPGDTGADVTALQQALNSLGYSVGTVDGNYGPSTQDAVARFQAAKQLTSDGIFGQATLAALTSALQGP